MAWSTNYCTMAQSHIPYAFKVNPRKSDNHHFFLLISLKILTVENCRYHAITISEKNIQ